MLIWVEEVLFMAAIILRTNLEFLFSVSNNVDFMDFFSLNIV